MAILSSAPPRTRHVRPARATTRPRSLHPVHRTTRDLLVGLAVLAASAAARPLVAQDPGARPDRDPVTVTGVVVDRITGLPLEGAVVWLEPGRHATMTDEAGRFAFGGVHTGHMQLFVEQLGYANFTLTQMLEAGADPIRVTLEPVPVVLEGLHVMADRLKARRLSTGVSVRTLDAGYLSRRPGDLLQAISYGQGVVVTGCHRRHLVSRTCVFARGQFVEPTLYIDDVPAVGGLDQLAAYDPTEVYTVEIYSGGRHIRVYTRYFMARLAMNPRPLHPVY